MAVATRCDPAAAPGFVSVLRQLRRRFDLYGAFKATR
jgi:hypothetical protein